MRMIEKANPQVYQTLWGPSELRITGSLKDWNVSSRLSEIRVPTLIISGRYDLFTPVAHRSASDHRGMKMTE
jgi:pimeloyl-ACP methyl ester carboxylesterase